MFEAMLKKDVMDHLIDGTFSVQGRPGSAMSVVDDITRIVWRNLWHNRPYMLDTPGHAYGMVMKTQKVVRQELARRAKHQEGLVYQATKNFDSNRILADLVPPHRLDIREARRRERSILPAPTVLPSYLLDAHHTNHRSYGIN